MNKVEITDKESGDSGTVGALVSMEKESGTDSATIPLAEACTAVAIMMTTKAATMMVKFIHILF